MTWFKEALERRTVSPFQLTAAPVQAIIEGTLFHHDSQIAEKKLETFKTHRSKIVDASARWDIFQEKEDWDRVSLEFSLTISHPDVFLQTPCLYGVHALCKRTRWRKAEVCDFSPQGGKLKLNISRNDVAGEVMISPFILHSGDSSDLSLKGKRLAGGFPVSLMTDAPGDRFGSGMDLRWYGFPEDLQDSLFYLDLDSDAPLLLINKKHSGLKSIFEDRSKSGTRSRLRNSLFSFIAVDVWLQLAQFAGEIAILQIDDDQDSKVVLSRKIFRSLSRMLKLREDEILLAATDAAERARLHRLLQHYFQLATHQDSLAAGLLEEASE